MAIQLMELSTHWTPRYSVTVWAKYDDVTLTVSGFVADNPDNATVVFTMTNALGQTTSMHVGNGTGLQVLASSSIPFGVLLVTPQGMSYLSWPTGWAFYLSVA